MSASKIHVKDSATDDKPLCGFDSSKHSIGWTGRYSAELIADCPECLAVVRKDSPSVTK